VSFDRLAAHYQWIETVAFGRGLQRARLAFLDELDWPRRALLAGEGNGRFLIELLRRFPGLPVDCIDRSRGMLAVAQKRVQIKRAKSAENIRFIQAAIDSVPLSEFRYDLIVTHFFLDCFTQPQLKSLVAKLARSAAPNATWLIADFCYPNSHIARWRARLWIDAMYRFFRAVTEINAQTLIDAAPFLRLENFACARRQLFNHGLIKSEVWKHVSLPINCRPEEIKAILATR
jgi:ubiquinone/menaquinone biosynthesis C-methylase UbiE